MPSYSQPLPVRSSPSPRVRAMRTVPRCRALLVTLALVLSAAGQAGAAWNVTTETIARITYGATNNAAIWGYHQPIVVRSGQRVYCALLEPHGEGMAQHWSLYERGPEGWQRRWSSPQAGLLNQPPSIVADGQGYVHAFAWPEGVFTRWRFAVGTPDEPRRDRPVSPYDDLYPYAGAAVNAAGELLAVASYWSQNLYSVQLSGAPRWQNGVVAYHPKRPDSPSGYDRQAYPFVAFHGRAAHVFTTQDIADAEKIAAGAGFTYSFRNLHYFYTPEILAQPFARLLVIDVEPSRGCVHNDDLLIDRQGNVHLLYQYMVHEGDWSDVRTVHAFGPPGGPLQHVELGAPGAFNSGRLWEDADGRLYGVLPRYTTLHVALLAADGGLAAEPENLGIESTGWGYYGRFFLCAARASAEGAPWLEGMYSVQFSPTESEARYFRAEPVPPTAVTDPPAATESAARLRLQAPRPNPFNEGTALSFSVPAGIPAELAILDLLGRPVRRVRLGTTAAAAGGQYAWDGTDAAGRPVASGVYVARLVAGAECRVQKVLYLR